jgi:hypothetical protein
MTDSRIYGGRRPRVVRPGVEQYDTATQTLKKGRGKDYGGVEEDSSIDHGNLTGLGDNDHPQYFLKTAGEGDNIVLGTSTGTKIGTGTTQKLGFYNATPIVQPANTVAIDTLLVNLGLRASGGSANFAGNLSAPNLTSGTYTPTLTNVANLDSSTAYECQYMRVGNTVTVSGKVSVDPTLAATSTQLGISLPVASNFGAQEDCAGAAFASGVAGQGAAILADSTNDRAQLQFISGDVTNQAMYFTFTYQII